MLINIERTWNVPCSITITYKVVFSKHCLHSLLTYSSWESNYSHQRSHDLVVNELFLVDPSWHSRKFSNFQYHRFRLYSENLKFLAMALEYVLFGYIEASIHEAVTFSGPLWFRRFQIVSKRSWILRLWIMTKKKWWKKQNLWSWENERTSIQHLL